jgi:hypothetical protein
MSEEIRPNPAEPDAAAIRYRKDQRGAGKFNITFGLIFIAWSAFDMLSGFWGEFWYTDIFFVAIGLAFIVYGTSQLRNNP